MVHYIAGCFIRVREELMHLLNVFVQEVVFGNILWIYGACNYQLSSQCPSEDHLHNVNKVLFGFEASNKFGVVRGAEKDRKIMTVKNFLLP